MEGVSRPAVALDAGGCDGDAVGGVDGAGVGGGNGAATELGALAAETADEGSAASSRWT